MSRQRRLVGPRHPDQGVAHWISHTVELDPGVAFCHVVRRPNGPYECRIGIRPGGDPDRVLHRMRFLLRGHEILVSWTYSGPRRRCPVERSYIEDGHLRQLLACGAVIPGVTYEQGRIPKRRECYDCTDQAARVQEDEVTALYADED